MDGMEWLKTFLRCEKRSAHWLCHAIAFLAWLLFLGCVVVLGYQIFFWLKNDQWVSFPAGRMVVRVVPDSLIIWMRDETAWGGLKKVLIFISQAPLTLFLFIAAIVLWCIGYKGEEVTEKTTSIEAE